MTIKEYLENSGENVSDLAKRLGVSKVQVYHWVNAEFTPRLVHALRIIKATNGKVALKDLLREPELIQLYEPYES